MSKPSPKKQRRRDKRKKSTSARQKRFAGRKAAAKQFPQIDLDLGNAPPPLANAVRRAVKRIQFENERLLPPDTLTLLRRAREIGFPNLLTEFRMMAQQEQQESVGQPELAQFLLHLEHTIGEILFSFLPPKLRKSYLTYNYLTVACGVTSDNGLRVQICSLCHEKTAGGTAYYSPHRPTVQTDCGPKVVAFSSHALERTRERTVLAWDSYEGNCHSVGFIIACDYFEPCDLPGSDHAFTFYNDCYMPGSVLYEYAEAVLDSPDGDENYYYRLGYCPAVIAGDLLVAKTLLLPGMNRTPEYERVLRRQARSHEDRLALRKRADGLTLKTLLTSHDFSLIRQFHEAGIPQVVTLKHEIFRLDAIVKGWRF
jgi:hypothetical protein